MTTLPVFDPANFEPNEAIDNPYFPLKPGTISVYEGRKKDEETGEIDREIDRTAVTFQTEEIGGVTATVVRDTSWVNGFLEEDTNDFYAQDTEGNVWYLGESTTEYEFDEDGNFIGTSNEGSWQTGINGALPGFIMEANPQVGDNYYQEFAPNDEALDQAEITSLDESISTRLGNFNNVLQILESTELSPGNFEFKYYVPNIGLVLVEEGLDANLEPDFVVQLASISSVGPKAFTSGRGTEENDVLDGDNSNNTLKGDRGNDLLQGFGGDDFLLGQKGNDFLVGGDGIDTLKGGKGQDILVGGQGADVLRGGGGRDQFVFRTLQDKGDTIVDFHRQDVIVLAEIFDLPKYGSSEPIDNYLQIEQMGSNTVISIDTDGDKGSDPFKVLATLKDTNANILSEDNFVV